MNSSKTLASLIEKSNGKMLTVTFLKRDGTMRTMNGRIGVKKYIKGSSLKKNSSDYITMYDVQNQGYRSVNRNTIVSVRSEGIEAVAVK
jgi:hypothetical protein